MAQPETMLAESAPALASALPAGADPAKALATTKRYRKGQWRPGEAPASPGRPKGVPNKVTANIREAIEKACAPGGCHPEGLAGWLIERACSDSVQDRQIFAGLVAKALPAQLQASVQHSGVVVQLGWLQSRGLARRNGTPTPHADVIDVQAIDSQGQSTQDLRVGNPPSPPSAPDPTPHPPSNPAAGGVEE